MDLYSSQFSRRPTNTTPSQGVRVKIPNALCLETNFRKIIKNSIFLGIFHPSFANFLKISEQFRNYLQMRERLTHGLLNVLITLLKMHF